jgi:uncharacterized protein (UPF0210 family)
VPEPTIRTLTLGLADPHPLTARALPDADRRLRRLRDGFEGAGYRVQTVRLATRPVFDDVTGPADELLAYAGRLQAGLEGLGVDQLSLGPADVTRPDFPLERLDVIAELLRTAPKVCCAAQIATAEHGIRAEAVPHVARTMLRIAEATPGGVGNFNFAALACVAAGHPFFPAGYHRGPDALTVGLQGAEIVAAALAEPDPGPGPGRFDPAAVTERVRRHLVAAAGPIVDLARLWARELGIGFGGIDLSPAPSVFASIAEGLQAAAGGRFGAPGTLAVIGAVTEALRTTGLPTCGYNGLMLPVLEDPVLAREWEQGRITPHQLLGYSAICGTGLDTVPLAGDCTAEEISGLLFDVATLARRLSKPLSARLFPLPGLRSGDRTAFGSPYLVDIVLP